MRLSIGARLALALGALATTWAAAAPVGAQSPAKPAPASTAGAPTPAFAPPPGSAKGWILVDADSGAVLAGGNERAPLPPASVFKVLTALVAVETIPAGTQVPVSARAEGMPARKINLKAGQTWRFEDLLRSLLLVSANDAAVALAERAGGSEQGFVNLLEQRAARLGLADHPVLRDAAGLDDEFSFQGGNRISARDLAIATQSAMAHREIAAVVALPEYRFTGGDGLPHRLANHNLLFRRYPGAIGVKTGYTSKAGHSLIAAARRDNRTMLAVVLGASDPYGFAERLLDQGFATPAAALVERDHLPSVSIEGLRKAVQPKAVHPQAVAQAADGRLQRANTARPTPAAYRVAFAASLALFLTLAVVGLARRTTGYQPRHALGSPSPLGWRRWSACASKLVSHSSRASSGPPNSLWVASSPRLAATSREEAETAKAADATINPTPGRSPTVSP